MELESTIQALIAVGASVSANCQPCLQSSVTIALKSGADEQEISEAIEVGKRIRRGAASKIDKFASELQTGLPLPVAIADGESECGYS